MAVAAIGIIILIPWLPYLGEMTAYSDALRFMSNASQGNYFLHPGRLLTWLPWQIVYEFSPDSFIGVQIFLIILQIMKAGLFYLLLTELPIVKDQPVAFRLIATFLLIAHSADSANYWLGTLASQLSLVTFIGATYLFLSNIQAQHWLKVIGIFVLLVITVNIHERFYPLIYLTPLLLWQRLLSWKMLWRIAWTWYLIPTIQVIYSAYAIFLSASPAYQANMLGIGNTELELGVLAQGVFVSMWRASLSVLEFPDWDGVFITPTRLLFSLAAGLLAGASVWYLLQPESRFAAANTPLTTKRGVIVLLIGIVIITMGFLPFTMTIYRNSDERTLYLSIMGAAICWMLVLQVIQRYTTVPRTFASLAVILLITGHVLINLNHHKQTRAKSLDRQRATMDIVQLAPNLQQGTPLWLVYADDLTLGSAKNFGNYWFVEASLQYVYETDIYVCVSIAGQAPEPPCELNGNEITILAERERSTDEVVPFEKVVAVYIAKNPLMEYPDQDQTMWLVEQDTISQMLPGSPQSLYNPQTNIIFDATPTPRQLQFAGSS